MKTEEDEAFDDMARRQGMWGGGYQAKRQAAMDKINSHFDAEYKKMHEDRAKYGTSWSKDGERIDPANVYLEQPAQEADDLTIAYQSGFYDGRKAALSKRKWVGMTDDEIKKICDCTHGYDADQRIAREVEAKLKEKNA